jgi:predicted Zn-dependent protease
MLFLKFGRDDERQSDELGHRYSLRQGYDVREMPKTFRTLERVGEQAGASNRVPAFMSTHPDPGSRVEATQSWADTVSSFANLRTDRDRYLSLMDGLVFGADPRAGYFENNRFLHPTLRFQFDAPVNWQGVNMASQVVLVEPNGQAQIQLSGVQQSTPAAAAQAFSAQQGVTTTASGALTVHGLPAHGVAFTAQTQEGQQLVGEALFIAHGGTVYQFLALTLGTTRQHLNTMGATLRSFAPTAANQQFRRVRELNVVTLGANTTAAGLAQQSGGAATGAEIALINGVTESETLPRGRTVKTVRFR